MSQTLAYHTSDMDNQLKTLEAGMTQAVDNALKSDDMLLSSLEKLACEIDTVRPGEDRNLSRIKGLCARYVITYPTGPPARVIQGDQIHGGGCPNQTRPNLP